MSISNVSVIHDHSNSSGDGDTLRLPGDHRSTNYVTFGNREKGDSPNSLDITNMPLQAL